MEPVPVKPLDCRRIQNLAHRSAPVSPSTVPNHPFRPRCESTRRLRPSGPPASGRRSGRARARKGWPTRPERRFRRVGGDEPWLHRIVTMFRNPERRSIRTPTGCPAMAADPGRDARGIPRRSAQPQPPRHDPAQDLARSSLDGELRCDEGRVAQHLLEIDPVAGVDVCVRSEIAGAGGKGLLQFVPISFTTAASTSGSFPASSIPATEIDMLRRVESSATRRPSPSAIRSSGASPAARASS